MSAAAPFPAELPERPEGWSKVMHQHMKVQGGGIGVYSVRDAEGRDMPFSWQYDTSKGGLTGFTLPDVEGVLGWKALREEWPRYLERAAKIGTAAAAELAAAPPAPPPGPLVDDALTRSTDPSESREAADRVPAGELAELVVRTLKANGPMTSHEVADTTGVSLVSISPRMKPLVEEGRIRRTGDRRDGRALWEATTNG